jgi:hypothetical protein
MHAAKLETSHRLQRVLALLADRRAHTTRDIITAAQVCAVSAIVAELRQHGYRISCTRRGDRWYYQLAGGV